MNRDTSPPSASISTVAVLGAGTMGRGIAHVAALGGFSTKLHDPQPEALSAAREAVFANLDQGVKRGKVEEEAAASARQRIDFCADVGSAVGDADLIIEAVPESLELKISVLHAVDREAPASALLASNTSALSISLLAAETSRPASFAGMHFFNPVHIMPLVELVRGRQTSDETIEILRDVGERMGKQVVTVGDSPGFVTSRINALIGNEAFRMLEAGVASAEDIDTALKLGLKHPMGPFEMIDLVGLDVRLSILQHLHETLGEQYRPSTLLAEYVRDGRLGRKAGRGVYTYDDKGRRID